MNIIDNISFVSDEVAQLFSDSNVLSTMTNVQKKIRTNDILFSADLIIPSMDEMPSIYLRDSFPFCFVGVLYLPCVGTYHFIKLNVDLEKRQYLISLLFNGGLKRRTFHYNPYVKPIKLDLYTYLIDCIDKSCSDVSSIDYSKNNLALFNVKSGNICLIGKPIEDIFKECAIPIYDIRIDLCNDSNRGDGFSELCHELVISFGDSRSGVRFSDLSFKIKVVSDGSYLNFFILNGFKSSITGDEIFPLYDFVSFDTWLKREVFLVGLSIYGFRLKNILHGGSFKAKYKVFMGDNV